MDRRLFSKLALAAYGGLWLPRGYAAKAHEMEWLSSEQINQLSDYRAINIPPIIQEPLSRKYRFPTIYIRDDEHCFLDDKPSISTSLSTLFHRSTYLGPTVRVKRGDLVHFSLVNQRKEVVTNHWHGLHIPGRLDGGPHQVIQPGQEWQVTLPIQQEASSCWYHSHTCGRTAEQVYFGHAGLFIIEDNNSLSLGLPDQYGINDIPIILQDKLLNDAGEQYYDLRGGPIFLGDHACINGVVNAFVAVSPSLIRFRILNAANDRQFELHFKDGRSFKVIAGDGGFLNEPVEMNKLALYAGERAEIIVDFTGSKGELLDLQAITLGREPGNEDFVLPVMKIAVHHGHTIPAIIPPLLRESWLDWESAVNNAPPISRTLAMSLDRGSTKGYINDQMFDMKVVNEAVPLGKYEVWEVISIVGNHPFHVHGCSFLVLEVDGKPPGLEVRGWKDSVVVPVPDRDNDGEVKIAKILVKFNYDTYRDESDLKSALFCWHQHSDESKERSLLVEEERAEYPHRYDVEKHIPYMYHCHKLHHEDIGMMGQFTVYQEETD